ncbi:hypothetical protein AMS68_006560 [Peltaster fructicola]|uniref:Uncharacterized protein n=1 Tax=Peltaster fructicola TaxID=286661 RepID=A0A6H0Y1Z8_9PEZI|nr:hypothetical protein AMS68_006560 [Peltaster fructicola]
MAQICDMLATINKSSFANESQRLSALHEARALCRRLERCHETVETLIWTNPFTLLAVKVAADMGVFEIMSGDAQTSQQLAARTGADPTLVRRILRMLASVGAVLELTDDSYVNGELSAAFKEDKGLLSGVEYFFSVGAAEFRDLPKYLHRSGYQNPANIEHTPFSYSLKTPSFWQYLHEHPETHAHFNAYLSSIRRGQAPWTSIYPVQRLLESYDESSMLCVDVGGGPVSGARAYFMHSIVHDWPDREAEMILSKIRNAMQSGYSKLLLYETIMPVHPAQVTPRMAAMDLNMMSHFAALERNEAQWRALFTAVGLTWTGYFSQTGAHQGIIEAELL